MPALVNVDRQSFDAGAQGGQQHAGAILPDSGMESSSNRLDFRLPSTFWCKPCACGEPNLCRGQASDLVFLAITGVAPLDTFKN
jgi:hypothetical protein